MIVTSFPTRVGGVKSINGVNGNVQIGGVNLLRNSDFLDGIKHWGGTRGAIAVDTQNNEKVLKFTANSENGAHYITQSIGIFEKGDVFTLSAWLCAEEAKLQLCGEISGSDPYEMHFTPIVIVNGWTRVVYTFQITGATGTNLMLSCLRFTESEGINGKVAYLYHPKLERGNVATDWTPAPEDILSRLAAIEAKNGIVSADSMELPSADELSDDMELEPMQDTV